MFLVRSKKQGCIELNFVSLCGSSTGFTQTKSKVLSINISPLVTQIAVPVSSGSEIGHKLYSCLFSLCPQICIRWQPCHCKVNPIKLIQCIRMVGSQLQAHSICGIHTKTKMGCNIIITIVFCTLASNICPTRI